MTTTSNPEELETLTEVLLMTKLGRMILGMGFLYTVVVSVSMGVLYVAVGLYPWTLVGLGVFSGVSALLITFRAPKKSMLLPAFVAFIVTPVIGSLLLIGGLSLTLDVW